MVGSDRYFEALAAGAVAVLAFAASASAQPAPDDRKPRMSYSIANVNDIDAEGGPLFRRMKEAFAAANDKGDAALAPYLAPNPEMTLMSFVDGKLQKAPFNAQMIRAATKSCAGPYFADEASTWVQLSWVCSTEPNTPLAAQLKFRESPELSVTVWFENGLIKNLDAVEPLPYPGAKLVSMDAYSRLKDKISPAPKTGLFGKADYPAEAVKNKWEGDVIADLTIGTDGVVKDCKIAQGSGHDILDQTTCDILKQRARFKPATDNQGRPVEDHFRTPVIRWRL